VAMREKAAAEKAEIKAVRATARANGKGKGARSKRKQVTFANTQICCSHSEQPLRCSPRPRLHPRKTKPQIPTKP
jgi:hypothetical protein